ncbi:hypothetical protein ARMSODRAFT_1004158 [Armillaria solidipes]|uniref:Uncharacterized protein n=1 Tax=Armillaria solidipes TaxID=1076256 RepID=A0A2H3BKG1_9AGAR|nr:hypothetical protein ARMSODRAFT_1004158 [Armillaria solidipes]
MTDNSTRSMVTSIRNLKDRARIFFWINELEAFQVAPDALKECHTRVIKLHTSRRYFCLRICVVSPDATLVPAVSGKTYGTSQEGGRDGIGTRSVYDSGNDSPSRRHDVASMASFFVNAYQRFQLPPISDGMADAYSQPNSSSRRSIIKQAFVESSRTK